MAMDAEQSEFYQAILQMSARAAKLKGHDAVFCEYNGLRIPVLCDLARRFALYEGQELSDEQMLALTESMALFLRRN